MLARPTALVVCTDSINKNQQEHNREDLTSEDATDKIKDVVHNAHTCFFCTNSAVSGSSGARPMAVLKVDAEGSLWFMSSKDSHKNLEIAADPRVKLYFQGSPHSDFLLLNGRATVSTDPAKIDELWNPIIKTWFTEGKDDPRISVIQFEPEDGYYWDTKHSHMIAGIKMLLGAAMGKTMDDSIEGTIRV